MKWKTKGVLINGDYRGHVAKFSVRHFLWMAWNVKTCDQKKGSTKSWKEGRKRVEKWIKRQLKEENPT